MVTKNKRIFYYDFLRTMAILFVILCHITPFYNWVGITTTPINVIVSNTIYDLAELGVPIFFMLSGALLIKKDYDLKDFLIRRVSRIFYPFLFWIIIILAGIYYLNGTTYLWDMFIGKAQFTWFVWTLMGMYLFIPIFNPFVKRYGLRGAEYYLILWCLTLFLIQFNLYPLGGFDLTLFAGWFGLLVLGYYLDNKKFNINDNKLCIIGMLIFIISLIFQVYMNYTNIIPGFPLNSSRYLYILTIVKASGFFLFVKYFNNINLLKDTFIGKTIVSISICSYGIYFAHIIAVRPFLLYFKHQSLLLAGCVFVMVTLLSWLVVYLFSKIPYLKKVCGV